MSELRYISRVTNYIRPLCALLCLLIASCANTPIGALKTDSVSSNTVNLSPTDQEQLMKGAKGTVISIDSEFQRLGKLYFSAGGSICRQLKHSTQNQTALICRSRHSDGWNIVPPISDLKNTFVELVNK